MCANHECLVMEFTLTVASISKRQTMKNLNETISSFTIRLDPRIRSENV